MNLSLKFITVTGLIVLLFACGQSRKEKTTVVQEPAPISGNSNFISSSAAVENKKDTTRKFIRTADLKFKVKSVIQSTYAIEDIVARNGGFVTYTKLNSNINSVNVVPVSADSSLETIYYTVINDMTLRVPNIKLDTTLKSIALLIDYLDYRVIKADDIALQMLANKLTRERTSRNEERLTSAIDNRGKKLKETTAAEELLLNKQEQSDQALISNLSLLDQVNFSTITLAVYQRESLKRELISNDKNIDAYQPGLGLRIKEALQSGWEIIEAIIVFIAQIWGLLLIGLIIYIIYKRLNLRQKK